MNKAFVLLLLIVVLSSCGDKNEAINLDTIVESEFTVLKGESDFSEVVLFELSSYKNLSDYESYEDVTINSIDLVLSEYQLPNELSISGFILCESEGMEEKDTLFSFTDVVLSDLVANEIIATETNKAAIVNMEEALTSGKRIDFYFSGSTQNSPAVFSLGVDMSLKIKPFTN